MKQLGRKSRLLPEETIRAEEKCKRKIWSKAPEEPVPFCHLVYDEESNTLPADKPAGNNTTDLGTKSTTLHD
jgi:hypothetical protein